MPQAGRRPAGRGKKSNAGRGGRLFPEDDESSETVRGQGRLSGATGLSAGMGDHPPRRRPLLEREDDLRYRHAFVERQSLPRWVGRDTVRGFPEIMKPSDASKGWGPSDADLASM